MTFLDNLEPVATASTYRPAALPSRVYQHFSQREKAAQVHPESMVYEKEI